MKNTFWDSLYLFMVIVAIIAAVAARAQDRISPQTVPEIWDDFALVQFRVPAVLNINQLDSVSLRFGRAAFRPWNASYWPTVKGLLANRYNDSSYPSSKDWLVNYNHFLVSPPQSLVYSGRVKNLSPAEKYDLLLDDSNWSLTHAMWKKGEGAATEYGWVPSWWGICHGWAAASSMNIPEPELPVTVSSATGRQIVFYADDIKALVSYLWATSSPKSIFVGRRCKSGRPARDDWGRISDPTCFGTNPMTWHVAILNRIGRDGDGLVMDASANAEVWNYAVDSYMVRYFNPVSLKPAHAVSEAIISMDDFHFDPFKVHRSEQAKYIVGVQMEVYFPAATEPHPNSAKNKLYKNKTFVYDLELDENLNLVGGEWHSNERPDFLWTYNPGAAAFSRGDGRIFSQWQSGYTLPRDWASVGRESSARGKVLAKIVNHLVEHSRVIQKPVINEERPENPSEELTPSPEPGEGAPQPPGNPEPGSLAGGSP